MSCSVTLPASAGLCHLPLTFPLEHGGELIGAQLAFEWIGPRHAPLVIVLGGISAGRRVTDADDGGGWWSDLVGEGRPLDTRSVSVLSLDFLGGGGASTGPANTAAPFPTIDTKDQARAISRLLDHLQVGRVRAFVGSSYGGMIGLAFAALFPRRVERVVAISAADRSHPMATAWRSLQRRIVRLGGGDVGEAMSIARGLGMTTYRTSAEFDERFAVEPTRSKDGFRFEVEGYLRNRGEDFASRFAPEVFLTLSESLDLHRVEPRQIGAPVTLVAVDSDALVPPFQIRRLADRCLAPVELRLIRSKFGHDAFLKEPSAIGSILREAVGGAA